MGIIERGGSVVTHETRIPEVPGSNPGADQPDWGWIFITKIHLAIKFIYHTIKI